MFPAAKWVLAGALLNGLVSATGTIAPKVMIVDLFSLEGEAWYSRKNFPDLLAQNISVPGLSPLYPHVHCTKDSQICQVITGEAEINAASTMTALYLSPKFDFRESYFLIAGISGVNPKMATIGSVAFARYAVDVEMQHEIDIRELGKNYTTGWIPLQAGVPGHYPEDIYGAEVFELNSNLRDLAVGFAKTAELADTAKAKAYRQQYASAQAYKAGSSAPSIVSCDVATSDVYFSGALLGDAMANFTSLITNGTGAYCMTAQEDNAVLEPLVRGAVAKLVDFSRVILLRSAADFDREHPGQSAAQNLFYTKSGAEGTSLTNLYRTGRKVVNGIINHWNETFEKGVPASNYVGDIYNSLGGNPDFGLPSFFLQNQKIQRKSRRARRSPRTMDGLDG